MFVLSLFVIAVVTIIVIATLQGHYEPIIGAAIGIPLFAVMWWGIGRIIDGPRY